MVSTTIPARGGLKGFRCTGVGARLKFRQPSWLGVGLKYLRLFQLVLAIDAQEPSRLKVA
ncbi:hypothetical protein [Nostoc sp. DedQUE08]|uniref:hypothetical protein n=1 Tax=Nostoc sp. DedQUE08 TaxID=3075393 RepID=UPI003A0FCD17